MTADTQSLNLDFVETFADVEHVFSDETLSKSLNPDRTEQNRALTRLHDLTEAGERLSMFCHDYKGNYLPEDRTEKLLVDTSLEKPGYPFAFPLMNYTDIFVYFSHNLLSLPPRRWISEARSAQKVVLGTILFEPHHISDFEAIIKDSVAAANAFAVAAAINGCDGYLINVEVELTPEQIQSLLEFIGLLKSALVRHLGLDYPVLVWYDAVLHDGKLDWQNCVNSKNCKFFEACDYTLTNYGWKSDHLTTTQECIAPTPGGRCRNNCVFFGVDIFARNTVYGVGAAGCVEAVTHLKDTGFSYGFFAPGYYQEFVIGESDPAIEGLAAYWQPLAEVLPRHPPIVPVPSTEFTIGTLLPVENADAGILNYRMIHKDRVWPLISTKGLVIGQNSFKYAQGQHLLYDFQVETNDVEQQQPALEVACGDIRGGRVICRKLKNSVDEASGRKLAYGVFFDVQDFTGEIGDVTVTLKSGNC